MHVSQWDWFIHALHKRRKTGLAVKSVFIAGLIWPIVGCGSNVIVPHADGVPSELVMEDAATHLEYRLSVAGGALRIAGLGNTKKATVDIFLIDSITNENYSVGVTNGALTLSSRATGLGATERVGLADTVTARTYELAVVSGALTLSVGKMQ